MPSLLSETPHISIHAPANGATSTSYGDLDSLMISIHAPANGATSNSLPRESILKFQSTLRRTERLKYFSRKFHFVIFQSTLRRTERLFRISQQIYHSDFNPRSDERSDVAGVLSLPRISQFQSTLRRTERLTRLSNSNINGIFQSTLRRTERHCPSLSCAHDSCISIHAPANGATKFSAFVIVSVSISIHAPANGATRSEVFQGLD